MDVAEIADHLGVSVRHVRRLVSERRIPYLKWGNLLRFDPSEVSAWLDERTVPPRVARRPRRRAV
jgi:excisionase family DNA binding protein